MSDQEYREINMHEYKIAAAQRARTILAVIGRPGTGKTTLMRKFMENGTWVSCKPAKLVDALYNESTDTYILGKYEEGEVFAGTDRLSMAVSPEVIKWLEQCRSNVIFEGDRLTSSKFFDAVINMVDTQLRIIVLKADEAKLKERYESRGSEQSEIFLRGRATKIDNITSNFEYMEYVTEMPNNTYEEQTNILITIERLL